MALGRVIAAEDVIEQCLAAREIGFLFEQYDARAGLDRAAALVGVDDPGERLEEGRLARAVAADQREPVTRTDMPVEPAEQPAGALDQTEIFKCEEGSSTDRSSPTAAPAQPPPP